MKTPTAKLRVLIDTDVDFDDYMAMLYLLKHPDIEVTGITVTGCGAVHLTPGVCNVSNMLTLLDDAAARKIPVARGAQAPMIYSNTFPADARNAADLHYEVPFPASNPHAPLDDAQAFLRDYFINQDKPTTLLCIGGGSNWGRLFEAAKSDPELQAALHKNLQQIVMMGGNLLPSYVSPGASGNIQPTLQPQPYYSNRVAEWNIFIDVRGAAEIFSSGIPITLVTLNAASMVPISLAFVEKLKNIANPVAQFISEVLASASIKSGIGSFLDCWDPLAACVLTNPELVCTQSLPIRVEQTLDEENDQSGMLIVDPAHGHALNVALTADAEAMYHTYLQVIAR